MPTSLPFIPVSGWQPDSESSLLQRDRQLLDLAGVPEWNSVGADRVVVVESGAEGIGRLHREEAPGLAGCCLLTVYRKRGRAVLCQRGGDGQRTGRQRRV